MKIQAMDLSNAIKSNLEELSPHLSLRIHSILEDFNNEELKNRDEIDLFEALVRLIFRSDREPASSIANLLVPLDTEGAYLLDDSTLSDSAAFLRDYLKKDQVLYTLRTRGSKTSTKEADDGD